MKKNVTKIIAATMATAMLAPMISACSKGKKQDLIIYNWCEYIAEDTIAKFEEAYPQYNVIYRTFETNEEMYPTLDNTYDVIIPSEYMVCRLIKEERIQPIDWNLIPNVTKYMDPIFNDLQYSNDEALSSEVLDYLTRRTQVRSECTMQ